MKILILGSTGFIGKNLIERINQESDLTIQIGNRDLLNPTTSELHEGVVDSLESSDNRICVINLCGAAGEGNYQRLRVANIDFPLNVLRLVRSTGQELQWLQASSFFQLYKDLYGQHKDTYSETKDEFLRVLRGEIESSRLQNFYLPHVFGRYDRPTRLIPRLRSAKREHTNIDLSTGKAVMPLMKVSDLVDELANIGTTWWTNGSLPMSENQLLRNGVLTVREIVEIILKEDMNLAKFDQLPDRPNEFYSKTDLLGFCGGSKETPFDWPSYLIG